MPALNYGCFEFPDHYNLYVAVIWNAGNLPTHLNTCQQGVGVPIYVFLQRFSPRLTPADDTYQDYDDSDDQQDVDKSAHRVWWNHPQEPKHNQNNCNRVQHILPTFFSLFVLSAIMPVQVHPRRIKMITRIGIGTPRAQSKIHPIFPSSFLWIESIFSFRVGAFPDFLYRIDIIL